jgi:FAD:protein FMN transferase
MRLDFEAIGTVWSIEVPVLPEDVTEQQIGEAVSRRIEEFDKTYSRFKNDSWITKARKPGIYQLPNDIGPLLSVYRKLYDVTNGLFTPLIGSALEQAGYDVGYSLVPKSITPVPSWNESLRVSANQLEVKKPVVLDFGAGGKGYLVDIVAGVLTSFGVESFCVDAGGDIVYQNKNNTSLEVGLEHPEKFDEVIGVVKLLNGSLCGSAGNRRKWNGYHHIINPRTRTSSKERIASWVVTSSGLVADSLATALLLTSARNLAPHFNFEYAVIHEDYTLEKSAYFPATFFT